MINVALHCLPVAHLRATLREIARVLVPGGRFLFHVNSLEDMRFRPKVRLRELEPDYFLEADGQTIHFFSEDACHDLLRDWTVLDLAHVHFPPREGWMDKCVWRGEQCRRTKISAKTAAKRCQCSTRGRPRASANRQ